MYELAGEGAIEIVLMTAKMQALLYIFFPMLVAIEEDPRKGLPLSVSVPNSGPQGF
jgi:hypothetical protein